MGQIPLLILTAILVIYILLGILYESWIHPITILSTLPSAGIGALLLMEITGTQFTVIAFIGILLLIGIVKKNAIMMIDFALAGERAGKTPFDAIYSACLLRFRPPEAFPPDSDDVLRGVLRRGAASPSDRQQRILPSPARHRDLRRSCGESGSDALHHPCGLRLS